MSTKKINVLYVPKEDKIWVWDGELLEAARGYDRAVKKWGDAATVAINRMNRSWKDEPFTVKDFEVSPGVYRDGNGDYISRAEAQAEADWRNGFTI